MGIVGALVLLVLMLSPLAPPIIGAVAGAIYDRSKAAEGTVASAGTRTRERAVVATSS